MGKVDLVLNDEGQQFGNMEEAASIARTPATCLEAWSGDHRQTPGGLQQNKESKAFRRRLINRPLALRGQTRYIQAHELLFPGNCGACFLMMLTLTLRLCRYGGKSWETFPHYLTVLLRELHLLSCGWAYEAKEKVSPVCLPLPLLRLLVLRVGKSGDLFSRAVHAVGLG